MFLTARCPGCGRAGPSPCGVCADRLARAPALRAPPPLASAAALLAYRGDGRELVARVKHRNDRAALGWLADGMAALLAADGVRPAVVTWVPTAAGRARRRGFDHARLLALAVAERLDRPGRPLLVRVDGPAPIVQTGRGRAERLADPPRFVVGAGVRGAWPGAAVLVVDDVLTTGATAVAAGRALVRAGAGPVHVVAAAATPPPRHRTAGTRR